MSCVASYRASLRSSEAPAPKGVNRRLSIMIRRALLLSVVALPAAAQAPDPAAFVEALYKPYATTNPGPGPLGSEAGIRATFSPAVADLLIRDQRSAKRRQEVGCMDADPFIEAQDYEIRGLQVRAEQASDTAATVRASFRNFNKPTTLRYSLVMTDKGWRIDDIRGQASLKAYLRGCVK